MNNQTIGILGVFAVAFFLFVLRHCLLSLGRPNQSRNVNASTPRRQYDLSTKGLEDDSWLLRSPDNEAGSSNHAGEAT